MNHGMVPVNHYFCSTNLSSERILDIGPRISELLHHYDCVIVPALGGFVTEYRSARIDRLLNIIHPPSKDLRFNAQLKKNDGLLANALSTANEMSHEEANTLIKQQVEEYFTRLEEGKSVHFEKVGVLYLDSHKNIQFSPDSSVNYLMDSFRLKKVYAKPIADAKEPVIEEVQEPEVIEPVVEVISPEPTAEVAEEVPEIIEEKEVPVIPITEPKRNIKWLAAAMIPLLFYIGYVTVSSDVIRDGDIQLSDLNPFQKKVASIYSERTEMPEINLTENILPEENESPALEIENLPVVPEKPEAPIADAPVIEEVIEIAEAVNTYVAPVKVASLEYHVIGGCFSELSNAEGMVESLRKKGYKAFIIDERKGLHRVAYGSFALRSDALQALKSVKEEDQSAAWLLRKK